MNFKLKKTSIYQAIKWEKFPLFKWSRQLKNLCFVLFFIFAALYAAYILKAGIPAGAAKKIAAGGVFVFCFGVFFWEINLFYNIKLKKPKLKHSLDGALKHPENFNLASFLDFEAAKICLRAIKHCKKKTTLTLLKDALLYYLISSNDREVKFVFIRGGLDFKGLRQALKKELSKVKEKPEVDFDKIMSAVLRAARENKNERIRVGDILIAFSREDPFFQEFLIQQDFRKEDVENLVRWHQRMEKQREKLKKWWSRENLLRRGSIARDWASGYTLNLDRYSVDLRDRISRMLFREIVGHKQEIKQVERILEKEQINNVLLVGEPGTGRGSIVERLAQKAFIGESVKKVNYKRILQFDVSLLVAETTSQEEAEGLLEKCFGETATASNIILVIDNFHNFLPEVPKPGTINIGAVLGRYLNLPNFQIIAITTYRDFHAVIERNTSLSNLFEKVEVGEISESETLTLLENYTPTFEAKHKRAISYRALREILNLSGRYLAQTPFPEKAIRLLDETMAYLTTYTKDPVLLPHHIKKVVSEKAEIPLEALEEKEKDILLRLEELIHTRLINQEEAVREMAAALRRARAEVNIRSAPIGSFLFLGPTGVGKTEAAKTLTAIYFKSEGRMLRFDMSEFQTVEDIKRLIGSPTEDGLLTTAVRENPFSLLLLDELEKSHPNILTLFLQVLDEGWLTDGLGRKVDFKNTIIVATSNAGAEIIQENIRQNKGLSIIKEDLLYYFFQERIFRPEFINRFDAVVVFKPLTKENLLKIAGLMLKKLAKSLLDKGIKFEITPELKEKIVELSYNPAFGAREMKRVIQDRVENVLAKALLSGELKRGCSVKVEPSEFSLTIEKM